ncbi:MAG: M23 family metallopeptidase [Pseudomonadota bacterium]
MRNWSHLLLAMSLTACGGGGSDPAPAYQQSATTPKTCVDQQAYTTPIQGDANSDWFITNYLDTDPTEGQYSDYRGGFFTYDQHKGTDFALHDFDQMDQGVDVYALKCGTVTAVHDGEFDRHIEFNDEKWNFVEVSHPDGSRSVYGHLKLNSLTVSVGDQVYGGDKLGEVGSSGNSTGPHLHLELIDASGAMIDPIARGYLPNDYVHDPLVLDSGVTSEADPALYTNFFFATPAALDSLYSSENAIVWFKVVGLKDTDSVSIFGLGPSGQPQPLGGMNTAEDFKASYWYWDIGHLEAGQNTLEIQINNVPVASHTVEIL